MPQTKPIAAIPSAYYYYRYILVVVFFIFFLLGPTLEVFGYFKYREYSVLLSKYVFAEDSDSWSFKSAYLSTFSCLIFLSFGLWFPKTIGPPRRLFVRISSLSILRVTWLFSIPYSIFILYASRGATHGLNTLLYDSSSSFIKSLFEARLFLLVCFVILIERFFFVIRVSKRGLVDFVIFLLPIIIYSFATLMSGTRSLIFEPVSLFFLIYLTSNINQFNVINFYVFLSLAFIMFNTLSNFYLLTRLNSSVSFESLFLTFEYGTYLFNMSIVYFRDFFDAYDFTYINVFLSLLPRAVRQVLDLNLIDYDLMNKIGLASSPFYMGGGSQIVEALTNLGPFLVLPGFFVFGYLLDNVGQSYSRYAFRLSSNNLSTPFSLFPILFTNSILLLRNPMDNFIKSIFYATLFFILLSIAFPLRRRA